MMSSSGKSEFVHQMENIVSAVRHNRSKVITGKWQSLSFEFTMTCVVTIQLEKQIQDKKDEFDNLKHMMSEFAKEEHLYRETLKLIAHESNKYKILLAKSNQLVRSWFFIFRFILILVMIISFSFVTVYE